MWGSASCPSTCQLRMLSSNKRSCPHSNIQSHIHTSRQSAGLSVVWLNAMTYATQGFLASGRCKEMPLLLIFAAWVETNSKTLSNALRFVVKRKERWKDLKASVKVEWGEVRAKRESKQDRGEGSYKWKDKRGWWSVAWQLLGTRVLCSSLCGLLHWVCPQL